MDRASGRFKPWKTCFGRVLSILAKVGRFTYRWWSSPTTTAITLVSRQLRSRLFTDGNVDHHFVGPRWARAISLVRNSRTKLRRKSYRFVTVWLLHGIVRRVVPIVVENLWSSRLGTGYF